MRDLFIGVNAKKGQQPQERSGGKEIRSMENKRKLSNVQ
jgi:hypothetical protein